MPPKTEYDKDRQKSYIPSPFEKEISLTPLRTGIAHAGAEKARQESNYCAIGINRSVDRQVQRIVFFVAQRHSNVNYYVIAKLVAHNTSLSG